MKPGDADGIPVYYENEQQSLRLLELPPEVLSVLNSDDHPKLSVKSFSTDQDESTGDAVLCSYDKTWALRQVQSSNSVFVASSARLDHDSNLKVPSLCITSSCSGTIEAIELKDTGKIVQTPQSFLSQILPIYDTAKSSRLQKHVSKFDLFTRITYSEVELQKAWKDLAAFELDNSAYLPSRSDCLNLWTSIRSSADALSIDLTGTFSADDLWNESSLENDFSFALYTSFLLKLSADRSPTSINGMITLDKRVTVDYIGELVILSEDASKENPSGSTLQALKSILPIAWHDQVSEETLCSLPAFHDRQEKRNTSLHAEPVSKTDPKRKQGARDWHEKFKRSKR